MVASRDDAIFCGRNFTTRMGGVCSALFPLSSSAGPGSAWLGHCVLGQDTLLSCASLHPGV